LKSIISDLGFYKYLSKHLCKKLLTKIRFQILWEFGGKGRGGFYRIKEREVEG
jgi:hypothetical protein